MKGQRIPHEQSAETAPRDREGGRSGRGLHVTGEHLHPLQSMWQSRLHWMRQQEWYRGIYSTLSPTDATAVHMPEISGPENRKDVLK